MKVLLDTHMLLWALDPDPKLPAKARMIMEDPRNTLLISVVSLWEITIKSSLGKIELGINFKDLLEQTEKLVAAIIPITSEHLTTLHTLPLHHRDPFDRLIIAQSIRDELFLLTSDKTLSAYGLPITA